MLGIGLRLKWQTPPRSGRTTCNRDGVLAACTGSAVAFRNRGRWRLASLRSALYLWGSIRSAWRSSFQPTSGIVKASPPSETRTHDR